MHLIRDLFLGVDSFDYGLFILNNLGQKFAASYIDQEMHFGPFGR